MVVYKTKLSEPEIPTRMKALSFSRYGSTDFLEFVSRDIREPAKGEVLIKVRAASLNAADMHTLHGFGRFMGFGVINPKGKTMGADVAGEVIAVGADVVVFKPGDRVFGDLSGGGMGAFADFATADENLLVRIPKGVTFEQAAATPLAGLTALNALVKGGIASRKTVLIYGASGGVGTFAIQLAKSYGAHVTAVSSLGKMEMCYALGADEVLDYKRESMSRFTSQFDLILGINGYNSIWKYKRALTPDGVYVMVGGSGTQFIEAALLGGLISATSTKSMGFLISGTNQGRLQQLADMLEKKKIQPVVDKQFSFDEIITAFRYFEVGHASGKVIITFNH